MGDQAEVWREVTAYRKARRKKLGMPCPECAVRLPKAQPKILLPNQTCWCGYKDVRERPNKENDDAV